MLKNKVIYLLLFLLFINNQEYLFSQQMDQSEVVKNQKFSVSVDFPETINFHFEGESTKKIEDIKVEFKTGDRKTPNTKAMASNPAIGEIMTDDLTDFVAQEEQPESNPAYTCITEYTEQTGKRFRMTKNQKERG